MSRIPLDIQADELGAAALEVFLGKNSAKFADNIEIPLHPFFGSMGVAPAEAKGRINSDTLEVRIQKVQLSVPYATNGFSPQQPERRTSWSC